MSGFSVTIDDTTVVAALGELSQRLGDMSEPLSEIGQMLVTEADLAFREQRDPWGDKWKALRPSTLRARRKGKGAGKTAHILRDTGRLASSISYSTETNSVVVGTNVVYSAIHQFGGEINRGASTRTLYFKMNKAGTEVSNRFVRKDKSNFAQDVNIGPYTIRIPARPFLPINASGQVALPTDTLDEILDILNDHLRQAMQ